MASHYRPGEGAGLTLSWVENELSPGWKSFWKVCNVEQCNVECKKKEKKEACLFSLEHVAAASLADNDELPSTLQKRHFIEDFWSQLGSKSLTDPSADVKHQAFLIKNPLGNEQWHCVTPAVLIISDANWQTEGYKQPAKLAQE